MQPVPAVPESQRLKDVSRRSSATIHVVTPLWESPSLSAAVGATVHLKMEAFQPVGSFKARGIGLACRAGLEAGASRLVCASAGNAGYAVAYAGRKIGLPVTVVVPKTTPAWLQDLVHREGATVVVHGDSFDDAHAYGVQLADKDTAAYIHPFDDPIVWKGHSSIIHEIAEVGVRPGAVVVSVGGGGLLCGLLEGMHDVGWTDVPILAVETEGAASFAAAVRAGRPVTLDRITSVATTLGARRVADEAFAWTKRHPIVPWQVTDRDAVHACVRFADEHRVLVEPACGASLAAVYDKAAPLEGRQPIVVIVCGGAGVSIQLINEWKKQFGL
ncbi:MAG: pyridoxal-phosphate dependent enzyme [Desulfomonilaceae bacterium]|nr:pyridoxal-phosphate dependent enzyme [Desulfomonilaceae bacterium]